MCTIRPTLPVGFVLVCLSPLVGLPKIPANQMYRWFFPMFPSKAFRAKELDVEIVSVERLPGFGSVRPELDKDTAEQFRPRRPPRRDAGGAY